MNPARALAAALALAGLTLTGTARAADSPTPGPGTSTPNFVGTTGLLLAPSAYTLGDRSAAAHAYFSDHFNSFGAEVSPIDRLELGFSWLNFDCGCSDDSVVFNGKFALLKETAALPGLAVGVVDAFDELDLDPSWYVVASKSLSKIAPIKGADLRGHLGYGGGLYDDDVFAGLELAFASAANRPSFSLISEYVATDVNLGLRANWKGWGATIALFDFDGFGGGITYGMQFK
jgi:hypothetical protein